VSETIENLKYEDLDWLMGINFGGVSEQEEQSSCMQRVQHSKRGSPCPLLSSALSCVVSLLRRW